MEFEVLWPGIFHFSSSWLRPPWLRHPRPVRSRSAISPSPALSALASSPGWFTANANNQYTYPGSILRLSLSESRKGFDWQLDFALPFLLGLTGDAIAAGAQGQLGFGATYFAANVRNTNAAMLFAKQGLLRFNELGDVGQSLKLGRMEFIDGAEVAPKDSTPAALKRAGSPTASSATLDSPMLAAVSMALSIP